MREDGPVIRAVGRHAVGSGLAHAHPVPVAPLMKGDAAPIHGHCKPGASQPKCLTEGRGLHLFVAHQHGGHASGIGVPRHGEGALHLLRGQIQVKRIAQQCGHLIKGKKRILPVTRYAFLPVALHAHQVGQRLRKHRLRRLGASAADGVVHHRNGLSAVGNQLVPGGGDRVRQLQSRLIDLKLLSDDADGVYGDNTEAAVRLFQQRMIQLGLNGLELDGVATPGLVDLLMSDLSVYGFQAPIYFDESAPLALSEDDLYAKACIVMEATTGNVLFAHEADTQLYPASTTKIMTLLLALERGGLDQEITIPACAADVPKDSSLVPVYEGEQMPFLDLLYGLIIRSGNDAANAVAELCAGSVDAFVARMNARAYELGMTGTHFVNPHGYHDPDHYTTARDLATLTRQGLTDPTFCQIVTCLRYTLPATSKRGELVIENAYEIFKPDSPFYIEGAAGVKSGYTSRAGFCYVGAAQRNGQTLIAVILDAPTRNRAWTDLKRLFAYGCAFLES